MQSMFVTCNRATIPYLVRLPTSHTSGGTHDFDVYYLLRDDCLGAADCQNLAPPPRQGISRMRPALGEKSQPTDAGCRHKPVQAEPQKTEPAAPPKFEILAIEQSIVDSTNAERARFGLPALIIDQNLMKTARQHGNWMASYRQLVHSNMGVAENIAMGQRSTQEVLRTWMNSSGHRANILNGGHRRIGVSAYQTPEGTIYWCQQFMP